MYGRFEGVNLRMLLTTVQQLSGIHCKVNTARVVALLTDASKG